MRDAHGTPPRDLARPLPRTVWLLSWVSFCADVSGELVYPLLPLFVVTVLGGSRTGLGAIEGGAVLLVALLSATAGWRSDRASGARVGWIRWGYGLPVLGKAVLALASGWTLVLSGRWLDRVGKGLRGAPRDAMLADAVPQEQRGRAFGLHRAFDTAGAMLGVLLAALVLWWFTGTPTTGAADRAGQDAGGRALPYRIVFAVAALLGLISFALTFLLREPVANGRSTAASAPSGAPDAGRVPLPRAFWTMLSVQALFALANSSDLFLLLRAGELGCAPWTVVLLYAVYNLAYAALAYPMGALSDRLGRVGTIALGWLVYAVVYTGFALLDETNAALLWPLMLVYGAFAAATEGVGKALVADQVARERRGTALGIFHATTGVMGLCASLLAGWLWDRFGPHVAFGCGAGGAVLALLVLATIARTVRRTQSPNRPMRQ